jgi:CBS domain-containing protein
MSAGEYCNREVVVVAKTASVRDAIALMRQHHVGDVVVVDREGEGAKPVGILTDRDIVIELLAEDVNLAAVNVGDVMSRDLATVGEDTKLLDALDVMKTNGVRRLPVVSKKGALVGLLTVDDILELVAEQLDAVVDLVSKEQARERRTRR